MYNVHLAALKGKELTIVLDTICYGYPSMVFWLLAMTAKTPTISGTSTGPTKEVQALTSNRTKLDKPVDFSFMNLLLPRGLNQLIQIKTFKIILKSQF